MELNIFLLPATAVTTTDDTVLTFCPTTSCTADFTAFAKEAVEATATDTSSKICDCDAKRKEV